MQNLTKLSKIFLFISATSFAIFIGSYVVKLAMLNQLFEPENVLLKDLFVDKDLTPMFEIMLPVFSITVFSFLFLTISFIVFLISSKINLKQHGWLLFIIITIFAITVIFEWILVIKFDLTILLILIENNNDQNLLLDLFKKRIIHFGPFPLILVFSYIVIIYLSLFKPLKQ